MKFVETQIKQKIIRQRRERERDSNQGTTECFGINKVALQIILSLFWCQCDDIYLGLVIFHFKI